MRLGLRRKPVDRRPTSDAKQAEPKGAGRGHPAERHGSIATARSKQQPQLHAPERRRTRMRPCGEDRRDEQQVHSGAARARKLGAIVDGHAAHEPAGRAAEGEGAVAAVGLPRHGLARAPGEQQHQSPPPGDPAYLLEARAARAGRQMIVAEQHAGAARQPDQRRPERVAKPGVGHQDQAGQGVTAAHRSPYRRGMAIVEPSSAADRLQALNVAIADAAAIARRDPADVTLIAISKTHDADAIVPLLEAEQRVFGENRVQEAQAKWPALRERFPGVELHLVGQLQSNKAEAAVALFEVIHSVDRPSVVDALARARDRLGRQPRCFVQVNIGDEPQKGGCAIAELPAVLDHARAADLPIAGLMCVPPADTEAAPYFALLATLARRHELVGLSMGMSADYPTAVMLGATHVRVGSALFGARP